MARLRFFLLALGLVVGAEALYRVTNGLEVDVAWVLGRITVFTIPASVLLFVGSDRTQAGVVPGAFALLLGAAGAVIFAWRAADAIWRGQLLISSQPKLYSDLATNPIGFEIGLGFLVAGLGVSLIFLIGGFRMVSAAWKRRFPPIET